ncbi:MAG: SNF2-related protein [Planctomycetota bacterium]
MSEVLQPGVEVRLKADAKRLGVIMRELGEVAGQTRYQVFHSDGQRGSYQADQLVAVADEERPTSAALLAGGQGLAARPFQAALISEALAHPLTDRLYAFQAARIKHVPFQYKPVLRLLQAERPRLLIADEVGVGKTIEAGLILKELSARTDLRNVLILCPKALTTKWRLEMRRFDEDFVLLDSAHLRAAREECDRDGEWPFAYRRSVVGLELLRTAGHLRRGRRRGAPGLMELDPPPQFDLIIVDEAHHLRNEGTNSRELADFLCEHGEAVVFLSATPVHTGSRDLYSLLNLLRPEEFPDFEIFKERVEPNAHLVKAEKVIRSGIEGWSLEALGHLEQAAATQWGERVLAKDERFGEWRQRMTEGSLSQDDRVCCLRDLEELNSLSRILNRTRRRDTIVNSFFTVRDPHTVQIAFTPEQEAVYRAAVALRRRLLELQHGQAIARLVSVIIEQQATSCLLAFAFQMKIAIEKGKFAPSDQVDDSGELEVDGECALDGELAGETQRLLALIETLPSEDPKLDELLNIVDQTLDQEPGKLLVFTYFRPTLAYLQEQMRRRDLRVGIVHGDVPEEERERVRQRFRLPAQHTEAYDVLLSSDVGCEGLDYEFCDRMVNYDIPWNPMKIEQRIGRIDRFGQKSEKVQIFNFVTPDTVEEQIYERCYQRLDVFRSTVGDCGEVLGRLVAEIRDVSLSPELSDEQRRESLRQLADNARRFEEEQRRLERHGGDLLLDRGDEDLKRLIEEGQWLSKDGLHRLIDVFLDESGIGGSLRAEPGGTGAHRLRLNKDGREALVRRLRGLDRTDRSVRDLERMILENDDGIRLTFDQEVATQDRSIPFVTPAHPLTRLAVAHFRSGTVDLLGAIRIESTDLPAGRYAFLVERWQLQGLQEKQKLVGGAWDLDQGEHHSVVADKLVALLTSGDITSGTITLELVTIETAFDRLSEHLELERLKELDGHRARNDRLVDQKLHSLGFSCEKRLERLDHDIASQTDERLLRMKHGERARVEARWKERQEELEGRRTVDVYRDGIAQGILEIVGRER